MTVVHAAGRTIDVSDHVGACGGLPVTVNRAAQPQLAGGVDSLVTHELGLPSNYGN